MASERSMATAVTTKRLMTSAIFQMVLIVIVVIGGVTPAMYINPWAFYFIWFIGYLSLYGISLTQILAFRSPTPDRSNTILFTKETYFRGYGYTHDHHCINTQTT